MNKGPLHLLHSWGKQEARALTPWQRRWLQRGSLMLALGLCGLALQRHHRLERQRVDTKLQQGIELAAFQWSTLRATAYDWAHWDETHAFARGEAPGYPVRNLKAASGLSSVAPVVMIIDQSNALLTMQGRRGASSWAQDPLVRCTKAQSTQLLAAPQTLAIHCRDQEDNRLWIGVIEPITDTAEQETFSGLMVLLAPLRHPSHGPAMQEVMQALERQIQAGEPGQQSIRLEGQLLWGPNRQVLNLSPEPVVAQAIYALGNDLGVALPFLLSLLGLRAGLMLQARRTTMVERQKHKQSQQRLRRARRQLEEQFQDLTNQEREQALRMLSSGRGDPVDDLARALEAYALALRPRQEKLTNRTALQFEPMLDGARQLQRVRLLSTGHGTEIEVFEQAIHAWKNLPSGVRENLGLQIDVDQAIWSNSQRASELTSILKQHSFNPQSCTICIDNSTSSDNELRNNLPAWRNEGFRLGLLHAASSMNSAIWLDKQWFDEVQIVIPVVSHPSLGALQQELIRALIQLAQARDIKVAIRCLQKPEQLECISQGIIDLTSGPLMGGPMLSLSELVIEHSSLIDERNKP